VTHAPNRSALFAGRVVCVCSGWIWTRLPCAGPPRSSMVFFSLSSVMSPVRNGSAASLGASCWTPGPTGCRQGSFFRGAEPTTANLAIATSHLAGVAGGVTASGGVLDRAGFDRSPWIRASPRRSAASFVWSERRLLARTAAVPLCRAFATPGRVAHP